MESKRTDWSNVAQDAFGLLCLFGLWLWQFETSAEGSLYHFILAAIGLVCIVGVGVLVAVILLSALLSRIDR